MNGLNGIIIDGKVYVAVPRGSYHCNDCALYEWCKIEPIEYGAICHVLGEGKRVLLRLSQDLTNIINGK